VVKLDTYEREENKMPRRESNIRKRKDGRWEARYISGKNDDGKSIYVSIYGKTYTEVKEKRNKILLHQTTVSNDSDKFNAIYQKWLDACKNNVKESTYAKYKYIGDHYLVPYFGNYDMEDITTILVQNYIYDRIKSEKNPDGYAASTVRVSISVFKLICSFASYSNIETNCRFEQIHIKNDSKEPRFLTVEEQKNVEEKLLVTDDYASIGIWLGLFTGMRIGEICALKWTDISWETQCIYIHKTLQRISNTHQDENDAKTKIIIDTPKSLNSSRYIPIPDFCIDKIKSFEPKDIDTYVLTGTKQYMEPRSLEYYFTKFIKQCQLENVHFHTLRHTFTTRCIESGFDVKTLSEILGHSNVSITLNRYAHSSLKLKSDNMKRLKPVAF